MTMTRSSRLSSFTLSLAAGALALGAAASAPASAGTVIYDHYVSLAEAQRMCDGMNGKLFLESRKRYKCVGEKVERRKYRQPRPQPAGAQVPKLHNFSAGPIDDDTGGGAGGGGGRGGNGSAGSK
jgi:hypothetical protein